MMGQNTTIAYHYYPSLRKTIVSITIKPSAIHIVQWISCRAIAAPETGTASPTL